MQAKATFGAGCFWGVQQRFAALPGVLDTAAGYAGGHTEQPSYLAVCDGSTGHAEVVEVIYDPGRISYGDLLDAFFAMHNPTQPYLKLGTKDRSQYRSVIFAHTPDQEVEARRRIGEIDASGAYQAPIVTLVEPEPRFWRAEEYHQHYITQREKPDSGLLRNAPR